MGVSATGQCDGAQSCLSDASGWGPCDCGGGGRFGIGGAGAAGSAGAAVGGAAGNGTGGTAASGGTAGNGVGGSAGTSTGGAAGSAGAAGSSFQQPGPNDDPCPTGPIFLNCSNQCAPYDAKCEEVSCPTGPVEIIVNDASQLPLTVRLPAAPPLNCTTCTPPVWSVTVRSYGFGAAFGLKVKVGAPWYVKQSTAGPCYFEGVSAKGCYYVDPAAYGLGFLHFSTEDPNAPSRNAVIEAVPNPTCESGDYWQ